MEVLYGIDAVLFFKKNDVWVVFGCAENFEVAVSTEFKSVKTIGDGQWDTPRAQKHAYTLSCSGVVQYTDEDNRHNHFDLLEYQVSGVAIEWMASYKQNDKTTEFTQLRGYALITSSNIAAPNDFVNSSFEMKGKGELLRGAPPTCTLSIDDFTVIQSVLYTTYNVTILSMLDDEAIPAQFNISIDGGAKDSKFTNPFSFSVAGLGVAGLGPHTIEIWPVCDNSLEGNKTTYNFITNLF